MLRSKDNCSKLGEHSRTDGPKKAQISQLIWPTRALLASCPYPDGTKGQCTIFYAWKFIQRAGIISDKKNHWLFRFCLYGWEGICSFSKIMHTQIPPPPSASSHSDFCPSQSEFMHSNFPHPKRKVEKRWMSLNVLRGVQTPPCPPWSTISFL